MSQSSKNVSTIRCCQCARPLQQRCCHVTACPEGIAHRTLCGRQKSDPPALRKSRSPVLSLRWYALFSHTGASSVTNDQHSHRIPVKLDGVPPWLVELIAQHPDAVQATLGKELSAQLDDAVDFAFPGLLADFSRAERVVLEFFAPRVWTWLSATDARFDGDEQRARMQDHLERAIDYLLRSSFDRSRLGALAEARLSDCSEDHFGVVWTILLLSTAPERAMPLLEQKLERMDGQTRYQLCGSLFATFGDRRSARISPDLSSENFTPAMLLALIRLAYAQIRLSDDIDRVGGGVYSPTARDEAQNGRGAVLSALLARSGPEAWSVKQSMRSDPLFVHFKDRLDQIAREKAASEAEGPSDCTHLTASQRM